MEVLSELNIKIISLRILSGEVGIIPFDTSYGVVCDPRNVQALQKLLKFKPLVVGRSLPIAVNSVKMAEDYADLNNEALSFFQNFLPGPYMVISKIKPSVLPENICYKTDNIGIRIPNSQFILELISKLKFPIICTGVNQYYEPPVFNIAGYLKKISNSQRDLIDFVVDVGRIDSKNVSTVVDTTKGELMVLRKGIGLKYGVLSKKVSFLKFRSNSFLETQEYGKEIAQKYLHLLKELPLIIALEGDMGVGKTTITRGVMTPLGLENEVSSPTFLLINEYKNDNFKALHIDTWRLESEEDLSALDLYKSIEFDNKTESYPLIVVEWADKYEDFFINKLSQNRKIIWVKISKIDEESRMIEYAELA